MPMLHREGSKIIVISILILGLLVYGGTLLLPSLFWLLLTAAIVMLILVLQFFRNPDRRIEVIEDKLIYAPADGKVVVIEEAMEDESLQEKLVQVSIFMSPLHVHVNRVPTSGEVQYFKYHPGKFLVAWHPKSSTENERTTLVLRNKYGAILMRQIAGAVARRIRWYVKEGQKVTQGEEMGFIKFGSRVDLFLPLDAAIKVKIGDIVKGNQTVIAEFK